MSSLAEIGDFRVTNREFEKIASVLKIDDEVLKGLPPNAKVLEIGSGLTQEFSRELKNRRTDITCIPLDPTLGIKKDEFFTLSNKGEDGNLKSVKYTNLYNESIDTLQQQDDTFKKRTEEAQKTGNVLAGLAPELPFANSSMDFIVDSFGPGLYLDRYEENSELEQYLNNLGKILKSGGQARIFPIDSFNENQDPLYTRNNKAKERYTAILSKNPDVEYKFYECDDPGVTSEDDKTRIGIIIRRK